MTPPIEPFPASELHHRVNVLPNGKRRKGGDIDLKQCELMELVQYACHLKGDPKVKSSVIQCEPVVKLFRKWAYSGRISNQEAGTDGIFRCAGGLTVETTAIEGEE